ncbi:hypothetical protein WOLCODRAFT_166080 [Wolfiporia cocos MD-104 SS10]|uniref:Endoplasmic reticulum junction formation protein lunapark n=1 Tax=Wolfiporia cocos (strain MD-104) TaxID=742152 RepID=A0A2H3JGM3_WOLCO|nr:hypothetical protein WOLCODRAFT_166080 [Wolfiporia cocos MD-104 SS10]
MVSLFGWFKKGQPDDYEQILASLALDIQKRQTLLSEIRLRERRATLLFSVYALAFWAAWSALWYEELLPNISGHTQNSAFERAVKALPVYAGPVVILFVRRIVQIWYARTADAEEKSLVTLRKQQREKIEEIKKKTNYYSTRNLLERYGDATSPVNPEPSLRRRNPPPGLPATPQLQRAPPQLQHAPPQDLLETPNSAPVPLSPSLQQHLSPPPPRPQPAPRKQWYDKLADAILGDEDGASVSTAASRYALICQKCFAHNGLVKESQWEDAQYVCPKCGHFNPSARSLRQARSTSVSPTPGSRVLPTVPMQPLQLQMPEGTAPVAPGPAPNGVRARLPTQEQEGDTTVSEEGPSVMKVDS